MKDKKETDEKRQKRLKKESERNLKHEFANKKKSIVDRILKHYPEPLFNLQFFNPYLKEESEHSYADI